MPNEIPGTQERIAANQRFAQQMLELQYLQGRLSAQDKVNQARQELEGRLQLQREADTTRRAIATEKDVTARKKIASDETKIDKQIKDRQERDRANRAVSEGNLAERRRRNKNVERLRGMTIENSAANEQAKMYYAAIKESGDMYQSRDTEYNAAMKFLAQIQAKISDQNTKAEADKTGNTPRADQGLMDQRTTVANNVLRLEKERDTAKDLNDLSQEKLLMLLRTNPAKPGTTTGTAGAAPPPETMGGPIPPNSRAESFTGDAYTPGAPAPATGPVGVGEPPAYGAGPEEPAMTRPVPPPATTEPTATNLKTGEKIVFRNGQWVPLR